METTIEHLAGGAGTYTGDGDGEESGPFAAPFGGGNLTVEMEQNLFELSYSKLF